MRTTYFFAAALMSLTPVMAFARVKDSANVEIHQPVKVAGTQLAPGQYKLIWEGTGPTITVSFVSFVKGKKTVATVPAKLVNVSTNEEAIETTADADNTTVLRAIDLNKISLHFGNDATEAGN